MIPDFCKPLWQQLNGGQVVVHEQEVHKANDIKALFELGLIRIVFTGVLLPGVALVLSEAGSKLAEEQK